MTDPSAWLTTTYDAGTRRWVENLSATSRRQATSVAASKLRQWVNRTLEERPSRGELRAWIELVLDERRALHNKVEALTKENEALTAQRDDALEELDAARRQFETVERELDTIQAQRDDAREEERTAREASTRYAEEADELRDDLAAERAAHDADVAELGDHRDTLKVMLRQARCERDRLRAELQERAKFSAGVGRAECPHTPGGGAK